MSKETIKTEELRVEGFHCADCAVTIKQTMAKLGGVESVKANFTAGKVTVVYDAAASLPERLTAGTGKIGIRLPAHPVAAALVKTLSFPITATSANLSGRPGCSQIADLDPRVTDEVDLVLDAGPLAGGMGSSVVDVTVDPPRILREGAVSSTDIGAVWGKKDCVN